MRIQKQVRPLRWFYHLFSAFVVLALSFAPLGFNAQVRKVQAQASTIDILVVDAQTGDPIPNFKWMVNLDNSHDAASLTPPASYSPVIAAGDQSNASGVLLPDTVAPNRGYLVTILANDGVGTLNDPDYKIGGAYFQIPDDDGEVVVELQPNPLPLAAIRVRVFHDNRMVNGEDDIPQEEGLAGFHVTLADRVGEVTTDWYGDPICGTGFCTTDADGYATIPNMGPDKYAVEVIPPDGAGWIQTTTIEGTHHIDAWVEEGHSGFSTEEGFLQAVVWFGFVRECEFGDGGDDCTSATADMGGRHGVITGTARSISLDDESGLIVLGNPVASPYIALNNIGGNDEQVYTGRGNPDGTFTIPNVPKGLYQLVIWDYPLDHIIQFLTVEVTKDNCGANLAPCTVNMGDIGVPPWFGRIRGTVYIDENENGMRDPDEVSLPNQDLDTRFKDGTIQYTSFADSNGNYIFPEVFELEHFAIAEVGYGRFRQTGAAGYETDPFGEPLNYPAGFINQDLGLASLLQAEVTWAGTTNYIDWGKKPFGPGENGGIVGIIFYAMTRNELDARLQAAEDYEPGVPNVPINLYAPLLDQNGDPVYDPLTGEIVKDHLAAVYKGGAGSDSWYDDTLPTDCIARGSVGRTPGEIQPPNIFSDCIELPALLQQIRPGVFDGGYAFDADCFDPLGLAATDPDGDDDSDQIPNRYDPDLLLDYDGGACSAIPAGQWVVQVVPPDGYQVVKEEDINVFSGDQFVPAIPPPACAGPLHQVDVQGVAPDGMDDSIPSTPIYNPDFAATPEVLAPSGFGSPYEGQMMPLCSERLIDLKTGQNANSDFFIFTEVPQPGRIVGVLLDDLVLELDPASPMYAEKRGIPNAPIGIRDYTGRLITTVYSDENGYWEVLLPSTDTYNCALPAGPCPGMYQVVGNDPGTPSSPNAGWNPNYGTLKLTFDVWPGLTTYADVAILPITGFVQGVNSQFETPPVCTIPGTTPNIQSVSQPYGSSSDGGSFFINGSGFGDPQGSGTVKLDGISLPALSWSDTAIEIEMVSLSLVSAGPHQLTVTADNGQTSPVGITFHALGAGYSPNMVHVPGDYSTIQGALNAAADGDLIIVHPGVYFESLLMDERVKLQGYGPGAGGTTIDGRFFNFGGVSADDFAALIAATAYDGPDTVPMGQVITVLAETGEFTPSGFDHAQIDGFAIRGGMRVRGNVATPSQGGGIYAHAYATSLEVSNNLIQSNAGHMGGGVIFGQPFVTNPDSSNNRDNQNDNVRVHHNRVLNNGGVSAAGALALFNGTQNYEIDHNVVCGNYSAEYGGGISNFGFSSGSIHDNQILYNYAFDEGGGVMIAGEQPVGDPDQLSAGTGSVDIERNLIQGNVSNDDGGGVRLLTPVAGRIRIINNMIVNNLATDSGGGLALDDALSVEIINNTVVRNISTATAEDADRTTCSPPLNGTCPHGAGLVSEGHSLALLTAIANNQFNCTVVNCSSNFSNPLLFNNIFWQNEAFYLDGQLDLLGTQGLPSAGIMDLEVLSNGHYSGKYNDCTAFTSDCPSNGTNHNITSDPLLLASVDLDFQALAFSGDPSFVTVIVNSTPGDPQGNYHVPGGSPVVDAGAATISGVSAPCNDFDFDGRPNGPANDIGADEQPGVPGTSCVTGPPPPPPPGSVQFYFSTADNANVPGVSGPFDNADIYAWTGTSYGRIFDGSSVGLAGNADIDALVVVDSDTFYMSFDRNAGTSVPTLGTVQDEAIVKFDAGLWSLYFDGTLASVGLGNGDAEDVDAFEILPSGNILVSTVGNPTVPGVTSAADEDLLECAPTFTSGTVTSCTWTMYFDGSDVSLTAGGEDVDGAAVSGANLYMTTTGGFNVAGPLSGGNEDVFVCNSATTGSASACTSFSLFFDGSASGITNNLDAIDLP